MDNNTPVYDFEDAINFISERYDTSKEIIETILMLEEDYMRSIGIISDEEPDIKWNFQVIKREIYIKRTNRKGEMKLCVSLRVELF